MKIKISEFVMEKRSQVSMEFILLTGGVVVAALIFFTLSGSIQNFANVVSNWTETERNATISKITR
ncbi:MAG: class III signal peptide-containing protein [Candidatus Hydrothermarchaeales archaeon]